MKKLFHLILIFYTLISCTVEEKIVFNDDFSGEYTFTYDFKELLESLQKEGDSIEENVPPQINFEELNISGISNYKTDFDPTGIFTLSFSFNKPEDIDQFWSSELLANDSSTAELFFLKRKRFNTNKNSCVLSMDFTSNKSVLKDKFFEDAYTYKIKISAPNQITTKPQGSENGISINKNQLEYSIDSERFKEIEVLNFTLR